MTTETVEQTAVEQEARHLHDLILLRDLLADRVSSEELRRYNAAIAVARDRLAALAHADTVELAA
jgi:hypothetical protein